MTLQILGRIGRREESLAVQSVILTGARVVGFVFTFAIPLVLVRVFDQATFGDYKQLFLISGTVIPILSLGLWASIFYFVPRDEGEGQRYVLQALGLLSLSGGLAGVILTLGAQRISEFFGAPQLAALLPLVGLYVFLATPTELVLSLPVTDRRPTVAGLTMAGSDLLRAAAIIAAGIVLRSLEAVLWVVVGISIVRGVWLLIYLRLRRAPITRPVNRTDLGDQLRYSLPFAAAVLFEIGLARFHQYFVASQVSSSAFAIYAVGIMQIPIIGLLVQSVVEVMLVRSAAAHDAGDRAELRRVWLTALERLAVVLIPCWALAELFSADLIVFLFGDNYASAVPIFRTFLIFVLLLLVLDHGILRATGDTGYLLKASGLGFLTTVLAVVALGRYSIFLGAVSGYLLGVVAMRVLGLLKVSKRLELRLKELLPWRLYGRLAVAVAISAVLAASAYGIPYRGFRLLVGGLLFAIVYSAVVLRWNLVPRREVHALLTRFIPVYRWSS